MKLTKAYAMSWDEHRKFHRDHGKMKQGARRKHTLTNGKETKIFCLDFCGVEMNISNAF